MTNNYTSHQRKLRQLKSLSKQLKQLLNGTTVSEEAERLILKTKRLIHELKSVFAAWQLKKVLGPACFLLGIAFTNTSSAQITFTTSVKNPYGLAPSGYLSNVGVADIDNDGDKDFICNEYYGQGFYGFTNTGSATAPAFGAMSTNPFGLMMMPDTNYHQVSLADLDNDGDKDLIVGMFNGDILYYQNTGTASAPSFNTPATNPFGLTAVYYVAAPTFVDFDNDGDWDIVSGEYGGNLQYFQNTGSITAPAFGAPVANPGGIATTATFVAYPAFGDMDGDGDKDLFVGEKGGGTTSYFQNTGTASVPAYAAPLTNPFGLTSVTKVSLPSLVDLDNDGDLDLMITDYNGDFNYFRNVSIPTGITALQGPSVMTVYPNPTTEFIKVKGQWIDYVASIEVMDVTGRVVASQLGNKPMNVKDLAQGVYTVKISHENGSFEIKQLQKQ